MKKRLRVLSFLTTICILLGCVVCVPVAADVAVPPEIILPRGYVLSVGDDSSNPGVGKGSENGLCFVYLLTDGTEFQILRIGTSGFIAYSFQQILPLQIFIFFLQLGIAVCQIILWRDRRHFLCG